MYIMSLRVSFSSVCFFYSTLALTHEKLFTSNCMMSMFLPKVVEMKKREKRDDDEGSFPFFSLEEQKKCTQNAFSLKTT